MEKKFKVIQLGGRFATATEEAKELAKVNAELVKTDCKSESEIIEAARDADVILTGWGARITRQIIEALPKCKAIITGSVGFDFIDIDAATENGIVVVNNPSPQWCIEEVSNHTITMLLACARKLVLLDNYTKQGRWADGKQAQSPMGSIYWQTLGIVGCGSIGGMVAKKAQCFGLRVLANDPYIDAFVAREKGVTLVSLPELLKESDFVSVHPPLNDETWHLISEEEFKQMKPSAYLINTARGPIVDESALIKALQERWIAGAGLDVFEHEPLDPSHPLLKMDNVVVTPHSASYSTASYKRPRIIVIQETIRVLSGRWPKNVVNKIVRPKLDLVRED